MDETPRILIIEDEPDIIELLTFHLEREGYAVSSQSHTNNILQTITEINPQLLILDLMLPGKNGYDICKLIKNNPETSQLPILIISAKSEESDIITGLEIGADDYIPKPFSPKIVIARARALLRRQPSPPSTEKETTTESLIIHNIEINPQAHEIRFKGQPIPLNVSEFKALHFLAEKPGWVFSRYQIVEAIRGENYIVTDRTVDVLIVGLRKKLKEAGDIIETIRGVGYRLKPE